MFDPASFLLLVAVAISTPGTITDRAGNSMENMQVSPASDGAMPSQGCTTDGKWCAEILTDGGKAILHIYTRGGSGVNVRYDLSESASEGDDCTYALSPRIIRLADMRDGVLIGVTQNVTTMYSGGGGGASALRLLHVMPGKPALETVLTVPVDGSMTIRACFSEKDMRQRANACEDDYGFTGNLTLDPTVAAGGPRLIYSTQATSFPGHVSRSEDSLARPPLHKRDLITVTDPRCSYRRVFRMTPPSRSYQPNSPLPDCDDYTVP